MTDNYNSEKNVADNHCHCEGQQLEIDGVEHCFEIFAVNHSSWINSEQICSQQNGHLAHFASSNIFNNLSLYIKKDSIFIDYILINQ